MEESVKVVTVRTDVWKQAECFMEVSESANTCGLIWKKKKKVFFL